MTTKELLYVKTVADEKNISRAAKKLFIAQPSLSQSIQRIEESVGTELFNRTSGGLTLTFAGEPLLPYGSSGFKAVPGL